MGAAGHGYVWPAIMLATDGEVVQVWAKPSTPNSGQSVRYINSLKCPARIAIIDFQAEISEFVESVLLRLRCAGLTDTPLSNLWKFVQEDSGDCVAIRMRRLEAQLGYDPEECSDEILTKAVALEDLIGEQAVFELAPAFRPAQGKTMLEEIQRLADLPGLPANPRLDRLSLTAYERKQPPWELGVSAAHQVRAKVGNLHGPISSADFYAILGLDSRSVADWIPQSRQKAAVALPCSAGGLLLKPRKRHPKGQRFEFARLLGAWLAEDPSSSGWLASTDSPTSRQKFQRAFAAEFLCPIQSLTKFLDGDFSETAIEEAAATFDVSEMTVESLLANGGLISQPLSHNGFPYDCAVL